MWIVSIECGSSIARKYPSGQISTATAPRRRLLSAAIDEARRRGRLPPNLGAKSRDTDQTSHDATQAKSRVARVAQPSWKSNTDDVSSSLTLGQLRAIRAAFKAGVKPSVIARQFGVSQSEVRKVLAADAHGHKSDR
jgi:hypothetical protein